MCMIAHLTGDVQHFHDAVPGSITAINKLTGTLTLVRLQMTDLQMAHNMHVRDYLAITHQSHEQYMNDF